MSKLAISNKLSILNQIDSGVCGKQLASEYCVSPSTISKIKRNGSKYRSLNDNYKKHFRLPNESTSSMDKQISDFVSMANIKGFPINHRIIKAKAKSIARKEGIEFKASNTWFAKMKKRVDLTYYKARGKAINKSADSEQINNWFEKELPEIINAHPEYTIYNAHEIDLQFKSVDQKSYHVKGANKNGVKVAVRDRVTILLCVGINGEKKDPLVIGKSAKPHSLATILYDTKRFNIDYKSSRNASITTDLFDQWLSDWNSELISQNKKVLLFIDNCKAHHVPDQTKYCNLKIIFLPVNTKSNCQPLDAGIINSFKQHYFGHLNCFLAKLIPTEEKVDDLTKAITLKEALEWIQQAWEKVKQLTIINCFSKCHFFPSN
ncbi:tigger transposable element-derived protein 6-like [Panonychus citri]|uniref:tigger transposable element-derived protein 6-like n=1 Tax=Panonychus citri TaxID=50023 RepID=UPI0023074307|nr:tigger transposable element-derived protein 6-like [Panonychus citri]